MTLSSRGLGHHPFTVSTGVRIPVGSPNSLQKRTRQIKRFRQLMNRLRGVVVQLVRIPACHAGGRGFEPRPLRQHTKSLASLLARLFCFCPSMALVCKRLYRVQSPRFLQYVNEACEATSPTTTRYPATRSPRTPAWSMSRPRLEKPSHNPGQTQESEMSR